MDNQRQSVEQRVVGLDVHPDSFTAAVVRGPRPAAAIVEKVFNKIPLTQLERWAKKHTTREDLLVMEAGGNSFQIVRSLAAQDRSAKVLESCQVGKLKEAHANNDKISAVRIAKAYLSGTAKVVWVPDPKTQERRDLFHVHRKAVKRLTQTRNRLKSYLSDNGVRLPPKMALTNPANALEPLERLRAIRAWSVQQWQVIEGLHLELRHADEQRRHWRSLVAREVLADAQLLSMVRLCGIREIVAFALGALIGDIKRFAKPGSLVKYVGLNPALDQSGNGAWSGGIGGHGRKDLRGLLIESAHSILRASQNPLAKWGKRLLARKGEINLVVAALARKLTVAVWYLMMGRWTPLEQIDERLQIKLAKIVGQVGDQGLKQLNKTRKEFRNEIEHRLKSGRTYILGPDRMYVPKPAPAPAL